MDSQGEATQLLKELRAGDKNALDELIPLVYDELRALAARYLHQERPDHTLQTTALVHEAYLRLIDQRDAQYSDRAHFLAIASSLIRRILIDHARARGAAKRGSSQKRQPLREDMHFHQSQSLDLLALDEALNRLADTDPRKCRVVELRYFGGLSSGEIAEVVSVSTATVEREWRTARAWLYRELGRGEPA